MPTIDGSGVLVFAPAYNAAGKRDATGAFQPEAKAFRRHHGVPAANLVLVDNRLDRVSMRHIVLDTIAARRKASAEGRAPAAVAFFCHGAGRQIQFGFDARNVGDLARSLSGCTALRMPLFACSTGKGTGGEALAAFGGDGGFADALRDALCREGVVECCVDAHTTVGHTTRNPHVRRFEGMGSPVGGAGGYFIVHPGQKTLWRKWRRALRETNLRFDFPFMSVAEIHRGLT